jgi:hypothetical protein
MIKIRGVDYTHVIIAGIIGLVLTILGILVLSSDKFKKIVAGTVIGIGAMLMLGSSGYGWYKQYNHEMYGELPEMKGPQEFGPDFSPTQAYRKVDLMKKQQSDWQRMNDEKLAMSIEDHQKVMNERKMMPQQQQQQMPQQQQQMPQQQQQMPQQQQQMPQQLQQMMLQQMI